MPPTVPNTVKRGHDALKCIWFYCSFHLKFLPKFSPRLLTLLLLVEDLPQNLQTKTSYALAVLILCLAKVQ